MFLKHIWNNIIMKNLVLMIIVFLIAGAIAMEAKTLPNRDAIEDRYKWNLNDIYKTDADWETDYKIVSDRINQFSKFKGKIGTNAKSLLNALNEYFDIEMRYVKIYFYTTLSRDIDITNSTYQILHQRSQKLSSDFSAATAFFMPELMEIQYSKIEKFMKEEKGLKIFEHKLHDMFRSKPHTLSADEERLLAKLSPVMRIPSETYGILNDAELPFPTIIDNEGNELKLSHGRYRASLFSNSREYRRDVYKGTYKPYKQLIGTYATLYNGRLRTRLINSEIRRFDSPRAAALFDDNIPLEVYDNLVATVRQNIGSLHRWANLKKRVLQLDELHPYDTYASLFPSMTREYTFDEAKELMLESLKPLGEEYQKALIKCFENRWIDVYETQNKRSGAYSNGCGCGVHPYILLNWNNTLDDVFTLAHELGHNMHSYFTEKAQPYHYSNYSIFVAEVASTTNEALLLDYLVEKATTKEEKLALIEKYLLNTQHTFFRQTRFADFEMQTHERAAKGEIMTAEGLSELFGDLYKFYWGPAMVMDEEEALSWARVHHLTKYNFYVFQYSTGFAAAQAFADNIKKQGQPAIDKYLEFLASGNSDYSINVLKKAGVDMTSPEPIQKTLNKLNEYLDELERILK